MAKQTVYDDQSIKSLRGAERVRERPAVIFGSEGLEGCQHSVFEIIANAVDEAREGYGDVINVTAYNDRSVKVEDFGRGVPLGYNEREKRYNWELVYCELYAGGKYENSSGKGSYKNSLGLNGLGAAATQYSSEFMEVTSYKGDSVFEMSFKKGEPVGKLRERPSTKKDKRHGTTVYWKPDLEVFTDTLIPRSYFQDTLRRQALVNAKLRLNLYWQNEEGKFEEESYYYEHGISDYMEERVGDGELTPPVYCTYEARGRERADRDEYDLSVEACFCFAKDGGLLEYYHNSSWLEYGGSPDKAVRNAFVFALDKYIKTTGKYQKNESKISFSDIEDNLVLICSTASDQTSYENQTKKAITNVFIGTALTDYFKHRLEVYFAEKPAEADRIAGQILINKRAREHADMIKRDIKKKLSVSNDPTNRVEKFVSCRSRDPEERELYIVEGDSALTSCKLGRDAAFQAIIPVRGKTLNCLKATDDKVLKNEIVMDLIKVIGCGMELHGKNKTTFNPDMLSWSKIIICTDADEDGYQIRTLLLTVFYRLLPALLHMGKVYIAESPLYEITVGDEVMFAYDEREKAEITAKLAGKRYTLQRSKGLGENEPDMMWNTTMNPATRRLIRVSEAEAERTAYIFETLLGEDLEERKDFIAKYGKMYLAEADI